MSRIEREKPRPNNPHRDLLADVEMETDPTLGLLTMYSNLCRLADEGHAEVTPLLVDVYQRIISIIEGGRDGTDALDTK